MARIFNAADRPKRGCATREGLDQRCPNTERRKSRSMNALCSSPIDARRCCHAPDGTALDRGGPLGRGRVSRQRHTSIARGQSGAFSVRVGSGRVGGPDHGFVGNGAHGCVAHARCIFTGRCRVGGVRRCAYRQAHLPRMWRCTKHCAGTKSSRSLTSCPMRCIGWPQSALGQVVFSGSWW